MTYFFKLKNNTTIEGLLRTIDGFLLSLVDLFFILSKCHPQVAFEEIFHSSDVKYSEENSMSNIIIAKFCTCLHAVRICNI